MGIPKSATHIPAVRITEGNVCEKAQHSSRYTVDTHFYFSFLLTFQPLNGRNLVHFLWGVILHHLDINHAKLVASGTRLREKWEWAGKIQKKMETQPWRGESQVIEEIKKGRTQKVGGDISKETEPKEVEPQEKKIEPHTMGGAKIIRKGTGGPEMLVPQRNGGQELQKTKKPRRW